MKMQQVSDNCYAVLNEKNRVCDANSGLINLGGGVAIDTQSDLAHAEQMIELFGKVWPAMPKRVINTHEDAEMSGETNCSTARKSSPTGRFPSG